jgi:large subunit ribosomal protein L25
MSQSQVLKAQKRTQLGSRASRQLRAEGSLPANIQGEGQHIDISIDEREFLAARRAHVHLYDLEVDGQLESAVVRELQWDTFGDRLLHVEFKKVTRGVETESEVDLAFVGMPKGGVVNHLVDHVTIRCIPSLIPDALEVPVEGLEPGSHVKASSIRLPEGVSLAIDPEVDVATIVGGGDEGDEAPAEEGEEA